MGEEEWLRATRATTLLKLTKGRTTDRKLRLFACGCLFVLRHRVVGHVPRFLDAVENATTADDLRRLRPVAGGLWWAARDFWLRRRRGVHRVDSSPCGLARALTDANARNAARRSLGNFDWWGYAGQAMVARDIFGNPFRPVDFAPWRTDTAVALAKGMYESRDFGAMPVLADALQDAGCDHADVLSHCRDPDAAHVRGCWVVDGVLGLS